MTEKTRKLAANSLNRSITSYQRKLLYYLELQAEAKLKNGNLEVLDHTDCENIETTIQKYKTILTDLATIKRAIRNNSSKVRVLETLEAQNSIYPEVSKALKAANLSFNRDGFGKLWIYSKSERVTV